MTRQEIRWTSCWFANGSRHTLFLNVYTHSHCKHILKSWLVTHFLTIREYRASYGLLGCDTLRTDKRGTWVTNANFRKLKDLNAIIQWIITTLKSDWRKPGVHYACFKSFTVVRLYDNTPITSWVKVKAELCNINCLLDCKICICDFGHVYGGFYCIYCCHSLTSSSLKCLKSDVGE